jgi:transcription antitermination protein NusB
VTVAGSDASVGRRRDTANPRRSRRRALRILFQADLRGADPIALLQALDTDPAARAILDDVDTDDGARPGGSDPLDDFTRSLVSGVVADRERIDNLIGEHARRWRVERMPTVDRVVLRLATYEMLHEATAPAVVIDEAVELAKTLSTADSGRYVNGVLEAIRRTLADATPAS